MKKWLLVLGMITCILGVSACGKAEDTASAAAPLTTEEEALAAGDQLVETIAMICAQGMQDQYQGDAVITAALDSFTGAQTDMGDYVKILDHTATINEDGVVMNYMLEGTNRNVRVEVILDGELGLSSVTTSVVYTFGELMEKAALNTVLGMGTVFAVLILISLIISCFTFIPKIQAALTKKPKEEKKPAAADHTIAQIVEKEEQPDDLELVAVITAAIAAGGAAPTDGFVVRSIRKRTF